MQLPNTQLKIHVNCLVWRSSETGDRGLGVRADGIGRARQHEKSVGKGVRVAPRRWIS